MNNDDVIALFLARRASTARNGRGNLVFSGGVLKSYGDTIGAWMGDILLISSEVFSATTSRHQSKLKREAPKYRLVPDLGALAEIMRDRDVKEIERYVLRRKMAISELQRKLRDTHSHNMRGFFLRAIEMEKEAARIAMAHAEFSDCIRIFSGFFPVLGNRSPC